MASCMPKYRKGKEERGGRKEEDDPWGWLRILTGKSGRRGPVTNSLMNGPAYEESSGGQHTYGYVSACLSELHQATEVLNTSNVPIRKGVRNVPVRPYSRRFR